MPEMTGIELLDKMKAMNSAVTRILMSAFEIQDELMDMVTMLMDNSTYNVMVALGREADFAQSTLISLMRREKIKPSELKFGITSSRINKNTLTC